MTRARYAVVGSRDYKRLDRIATLLHALNSSVKPVLVSGGARGVDSEAERIARELNWHVDIYLPDWEKHGRSAGFLRNTTIINNCDKVFAFWNGVSRGTLDSIQKAVKAGKPVEIIPDGEPAP